MCDTLQAHLWLVGVSIIDFQNHLNEQWQGAIVFVWQDSALMAAATQLDAVSIGFPGQEAGQLEAPLLLGCS